MLLQDQLYQNVRIPYTVNVIEYVNNAFTGYIKKGIIHDLTSPFKPEQNEYAKRELRTIMESARSLLYARDVQLTVNYAV